MPFAENPPPPPPPPVALVDPKTGQPTQAFFDYLIKLTEYLKRLRASIP